MLESFHFRRRHGIGRERRLRLRLRSAALALTLLLPPSAVGLATAQSATAATAASGGTSPASTPAPPLPETDPDGPLGTTLPADDSGLTKDQEDALAVAQSSAAASGNPVQVDALTTETATAQANPSGTVTWTTSLLPQRVRKDSSWVPVDATLQQNADGTYSPKAPAEPLTFSGGGTTTPWPP